MADDALHERLLKIVLSLPGAYEDRPWGSVHCKVAGKIFVGWGRGEDGEMELGFRMSLAAQASFVASDPRFKIAKYVGKYGGVDMRLGPKPNWAEVEHFIVESYRIIAPKKLVKELDARVGSTATQEAPAKKAPAKKAPAKKAPAKKGPAKKGPAKKAPAKKAPAKKAPAKKTAAKKGPAKKTAAKKAPAKKVAVRLARRAPSREAR